MASRECLYLMVIYLFTIYYLFIYLFIHLFIQFRPSVTQTLYLRKVRKKMRIWQGASEHNQHTMPIFA